MWILLVQIQCSASLIARNMYQGGTVRLKGRNRAENIHEAQEDHNSIATSEFFDIIISLSSLNSKKGSYRYWLEAGRELERPAASHYGKTCFRPFVPCFRGSSRFHSTLLRVKIMFAEGRKQNLPFDKFLEKMKLITSVLLHVRYWWLLGLVQPPE